MRRSWVWLGLGILTAGLFGGAPASARSTAGAFDASPLGATVDGLRQAGRQLSPALRAAVLNTAAVAAKAAGAGKLDDPILSDNYQFYRDPGVFSGHAVMLSQSIPLWGKLDLRREAALADVDAARGREQAARDELDEKIKVAYAQYYLMDRDLAVNREIADLAGRMSAATAARFGQGGGDQAGVIQALGEETAAKLEAIRLAGEKDAARARLNVLAGRKADAPLADPRAPRRLPAAEPSLAALVQRARAANPTLSAGTAEVSAARTRRTLADRALYPDITIGAGPLVQTNNRPVGVAASLGLNIPLPWGREVDGQREAAAQLGATQQRYDAAQLEIEGALAEALAKLRSARATATLLRRESVPQARGTVEASLATYSQGKGELATTIVAERQMRDVQLKLLQAELDRQVQLAAIERLIGGDL